MVLALRVPRFGSGVQGSEFRFAGSTFVVYPDLPTYRKSKPPEQNMGGCQNYGAFSGPYYNTARLFRVPKKGTIILTTTHMMNDTAHLKYTVERP